MLASVEALKLVYTRAPASSTATESAKTRRSFRFLEGSIYLSMTRRRRRTPKPFASVWVTSPRCAWFVPTLIAAVAALCLPVAASAAPAKPPKPIQLSKYSGWEIREAAASPPAPQPPPPDESEEGAEGASPNRVRTQQIREDGEFQKTRVPSVFDATVAPKLFGGQLKVYKLRFVAPKTKRFKWLLRFEQARRRTTVVLNGRRLGVNIDPYTPFQLEAKGLKRGKTNELLVYVDSRKDPRLPEGWWNWGGITRPVWLVPRPDDAERSRPALRRDLRRPGDAVQGRGHDRRPAVAAAEGEAAVQDGDGEAQAQAGAPAVHAAQAEREAALAHGSRDAQDLRARPRARAGGASSSSCACPRRSCGHPTGLCSTTPA